jgi:chromosome segregation ATPase
VEQEKILTLIFNKLENIEKEQQEMKKEIFMKLDRVEARLDRVEARLDGVEARLDGVEARLDGVEARLDGVEARLDRVKEGQKSIEKFILNSEIAFEKFEQDHRFIEKLKKVAGE